MTPKEQAVILVNEMWDLTYNDEEYQPNGEAIDAALVAVKYIIQNCKETTKLYESNDMINSDISPQPLDYWNEVIKEVNKL